MIEERKKKKERALATHGPFNVEINSSPFTGIGMTFILAKRYPMSECYSYGILLLVGCLLDSKNITTPFKRGAYIGLNVKLV